MNIQPVLIGELRSKYKSAVLLYVGRVKLVAFNESSKVWMHNCQGWLIVRRDLKDRCQYLTIINPLDHKVLFQFEHYSNFANYAKVVTAQLFFFFVVPTQTGPIKLGFCFQDRQSIDEFKKIIKEIEYKRNIDKESAVVDKDYLNKPEILEILKKVGITNATLESDPLFKENVVGILESEMERKNAKRHQIRNLCKFKTLAVELDDKQIELEGDNDDLIRALEREFDHYNHRRQP